ncbi:aminotransferase-like domain-containing protein [Streptomyces physcomitrii]|uniref:PLP-dependent aminotransferase family protein n=1 Tax=Streptomyces physcomitrii TaxID=2724184 RepID=A0ABX1GYY3_9ACTN|nr:PLP-dependent aminotransferase family protein [Streptomyces physcomitrii]NKI41003.1 PLP-dependent aminotransferase family protein [Streptomyces physcomitrii]
MEDYRRIADRVAEEIAAGVLRPGDRLPPQRAFARRRHIAVSTAGRVYGELVRRGLVVGEVGRGTFVRAAPVPSGRPLTEASTLVPVNLELTYPVAPGQSELLAAGLAPLLRPDVLDLATRTAPAAGTAQAREAVAALLAAGSWRPEPRQLLFAGNARQAIAGALSALCAHGRPGSGAGARIAVEQLTYPLVKEIADRLGIILVPVAMDAEGMRPDALGTLHRTAPLSGVYVQPTLHNPTSVTASAGRREELARTIRELGLPIVEDRIWSFLHEDERPPLAAFAPERTYVVDGLSKRIAPGLTAGLLVTPAEPAVCSPPIGDVAAVLRSGGWTASRFALEAAVRWLADGTVQRLVVAKRADAAGRQQLVARELGEFRVHTDPHAYYAWWELPAPWRADRFAAAAAERGIAVTPGSAFAVGPQSAPDAVRLGLASAPRPALAAALGTLAELARS